VALAEGVLRSMVLTRLKFATAVLGVLAILGTGAVVLMQQVLAEKPTDPAANTAKGRGKEIREVSADWPQRRGPKPDGGDHGVTVPAKWPRTLKEEWQVPVGEGVASPVVVGDKVFVFTRQKEEEVVWCLDLAGGKEIWRSESYPAPYKRGAEERNFSIGPRST